MWAAALIVTGVLLTVAAGLAMAGKKEIGGATPPALRQAIDGVKADVAEIVAEIKERSHR